MKLGHKFIAAFALAAAALPFAASDTFAATTLITIGGTDLIDSTTGAGYSFDASTGTLTLDGYDAGNINAKKPRHAKHCVIWRKYGYGIRKP